MALPKTFTGGERLFADDLNDNFEALDTRLGTAESDIDTNALNLANASNLTSGVLSDDRLGTVSASKLSGKVPEANLPYVRGTVSTSASDGVTVTFPAGSFTAAPTIVLGSTAVGLRFSSHRAKTQDSFIVDGYSTESLTRNSFPVDWLAVGI